MCTYNCDGIRNSKTYVSTLDHDIICLQETWLFHHEIDTHIGNDNYVSTSCSGIDNTVILHGRPYGGVSISYRKEIANRIVVLVRYSIYRSIAILAEVRYRYLVVSRYLQISSIEAALVDTRYSIIDTRYSILDTRYSILDTRYSILDPRSSILDPRSSILDTRSSVLDTRYLRTSKIDDDTRYSDRYPILNSAITEDLPDPIFGGLPCTAL